MRLGENMSEKEKIKKHYEGHRERLRQRFEISGFRGFQDYEVLELLLSFALSRIDTKPVAKDLLGRFKTLPKVFEADVKELVQIKGIKKRTAQFLKILYGAIKYYHEQKAVSNEIKFINLNDVVDYLKGTIGGKQNEIVRVIYLNSKNSLIAAETLSEGTVSEAVAFPRKIVEGALKYNATSVIIAHNHPGGVAEPSGNDDAITEQIKNALQTVNITLQEHIIITDNDFYSYRKNGYL